MDEVMDWLQGVLSHLGEAADAAGDERLAARVEAEYLILAELVDLPGDVSPDTIVLARFVVRRLAYGHRHDAPGWREEWGPDEA